MLDSLLRLLNSYPTWAKLCAIAGVTFSIVVLALAPRTDASAQSKPSPTSAPPQTPPVSQVFLRIGQVKLFPHDPDAEIKVLAIVNDTVYEHPSVGAVKWMKVGPDMSPKNIELPRSQTYNIRFEMQIKDGVNLTSQTNKHLYAEKFLRAGSQRVDNIDKLPFSEDYKLYDIKENTRSAAVRAVVSYSISEK